MNIKYHFGEKKVINDYRGISFYLLLTVLSIILLMPSCVGKDEIVDSEETNQNDTPKEPVEENVVVLKHSDIPDYEKIYKPNEFKDMNWLHKDSDWSFFRSKQSKNFIVFWEKGFGEDPNSFNVPENYRVDVDDLLKKAESFFKINVEKLKFADLGENSSNLDKYKMQIYLFYQNDWMAYGSGYDDQIGAIWISPATCKPVGSTIAHEIGHSFQYQVYSDLLASKKTPNNFSRGFRYGFGPNGSGGNGFWEQTAQWQSFQSYPREIFESYNFTVYTNNYHRSIFHEWQRYASYFIHYFWTYKHGDDFISRIWREAEKPEDPVEAYMRLNSLTVDQMNNEMYEAASRFVTWDIDEIRLLGSQHIGSHSVLLYPLGEAEYQVAYSSCPGTTGYNVIPLTVPELGTTVTAIFEGLAPGSPLAPGDPGLAQKGEGEKIKVSNYNQSDVSIAGWRYGYVALLSTGERVYGEMGSNHKSEIEFIVPSNCKRLWFVVLGAPSEYSSHEWDEDEVNDNQWPYKVRFKNTDILGNI